MRIGLKPLLAALTILVVALIAGGKRGQDTLVIPMPSLVDDYLLVNLPKPVFRLDVSQVMFADREKTMLLSDIKHSNRLTKNQAIELSSEFSIDVGKGAPALSLLKNFELPLGVTIQNEISILVVLKAAEDSEYRVRVLAAEFIEGQVHLQDLNRDSGPITEFSVVRNSGGGHKLKLTQGLDLAELIILDQPLSLLQAENITDSLHSKWVY